MDDDKRLNIAMISEHASPLALTGSTDAGGQNVYVDSVARCLGEMGHQVDVLTRRDDPDLPAEVEMAPGVRVLHIDAGPAHHIPKEKLLQWMPDFAQQARSLLEPRRRYDAIHANFFMSGWVGMALRSALRAPLVTTFHALGLVRREHQGAADGFPNERETIERALVHGSDRLIAECPQDRSDLIRLYGAMSSHIDTVACGVDTQLFRPGSRSEARARLGLVQDEFIVLQLGRMVPRKGIDNVIRALALLPRTVPARLVVVGGEQRIPDPETCPELDRLMGLSHSLGISERVSFAGRRDREELRDWYLAADVFVTTPWYEPFGITPLEAMACGTPVIGSKVGGIAYTVCDGVTGYLVEPKQPQALAQALQKLHAQPRLARAMGLAGMQRVHKHFTWDQIARDLAAVFQRLSSAGGRLGAAAPASPGPWNALSAPPWQTPALGQGGYAGWQR
ncbi:MAG: glycosyltransferase family 4 protein [Comamonas sp.]|uniref:glycosyltransferase family 4 protein n=1 Tax=Comamonas sp. TaxID=34028 RepID=UPI003D10E5DD